MKKLIAFILTLIMLFLLCSCSAAEYRCEAVKVYIPGGSNLNGPDSVEATLSVSSKNVHDGISVNISYFGTTYSGIVSTGIIDEPVISWDGKALEDFIMSGSLGGYTTIRNSDSKIIVEAHCKLPSNGDNGIDTIYYVTRLTFSR